MIAAQKDSKKILVEIKSFSAESIPNEFHTALGQYLDYELGLEELDPDRTIFLALPEKVYQKINKIPLLMKALKKYKVNIITFDTVKPIIYQWVIN